MRDGSQSRRTSRGFAWIIVTVAMTAPGCLRLPVAQVAALPPLPPSPPENLVAAPDPATRPEPVTSPTPMPMPMTPPPVSPRPRIEVARTSSATPLLDKALVRAEALTHIDDDPPCDCDGDGPEPPLATAPPAAEPKARESALADLSLKDLPDAPAARPPIDPERPAAVVTPRNAWREDLERLRTMAHDRAATSPEVGTLHARLLDWIAEPEGETSSLWGTVLRGLVAANGPEPSEDRARASEIRAAVEALEDQAPLEITDLQLCRKVDSFGIYEPLDTTSCKAGQTVIVYCEISGLRYDRRGEAFQSRLSSQVEVVPAQGGKPAWQYPLKTESEVCRRRRRDYYVCCKITLPGHLAPGSYELRVLQKDEVAGRATSSAIALILQP